MTPFNYYLNIIEKACPYEIYSTARKFRLHYYRVWARIICRSKSTLRAIIASKSFVILNVHMKTWFNIPYENINPKKAPVFIRRLIRPSNSIDLFSKHVNQVDLKRIRYSFFLDTEIINYWVHSIYKLYRYRYRYRFSYEFWIPKSYLPQFFKFWLWVFGIDQLKNFKS